MAVRSESGSSRGAVQWPARRGAGHVCCSSVGRLMRAWRLWEVRTGLEWTPCQYLQSRTCFQSLPTRPGLRLCVRTNLA